MTAPYELSVTRLIDAHPDVVFRTWVERLAEWWCPRPWATEVVAIDPRCGGAFHTILRGPDGEEEDLAGVFLEVVPGRRIVTTDAFTVGWVPQTPFMAGLWTFVEEGRRTRYTACARHWTAEAIEQHRTMGFETGWGAVADQLAALAEGRA